MKNVAYMSIRVIPATTTSELENTESIGLDSFQLNSSYRMPETWDSVKLLIPKADRLGEIAAIEREYIDTHPSSGFWTEIRQLTSFPDYLEFLPPGAIVRKIGVLGYIPEGRETKYPYIAMTRTEYAHFVDRAVQLSIETIRQHWKER